MSFLIVLKWLSVMGLIINLAGACLLYRSVKPSQNLEGAYTEKGLEIQPLALLDRKLAKWGFALIILGFLVQLFTAVF